MTQIKYNSCHQSKLLYWVKQNIVKPCCAFVFYFKLKSSFSKLNQSSFCVNGFHDHDDFLLILKTIPMHETSYDLIAGTTVTHDLINIPTLISFI